jgi:hypothetical protein
LRCVVVATSAICVNGPPADVERFTRYPVAPLTAFQLNDTDVSPGVADKPVGTEGTAGGGDVMPYLVSR